MTVRRFLFVILLWTLLLLIAASDIGGIIGFLLIWIGIICAIPVLAIIQLVGPESIWAKTIPIGIGAIIAFIIAYVILRQFIFSIMAVLKKDMMMARRRFAYGYGMTACLIAPFLCVYSLSEQWP